MIYIFFNNFITFGTETLIFITYKQVGRLPPTFLDAAKLTIAIMNSGYEFSSGKIVYNRFKSVVSYSQADMPLFSQSAVEVSIIFIIFFNHPYLEKKLLSVFQIGCTKTCHL